MIRCPKCNLLTPRKKKWLCNCGYEFRGDEPEAIPTAAEKAAIAARYRVAEPRTPINPILRSIFTVLLILFGVGCLILAIVFVDCARNFR